MTDSKLQMLKALEEASARSHRRAVAMSWAAVAAAAVVMFALMFYTARKIADETRQLERVRLERQALQKEIDDLKPLVENYRASAAEASVEAMRDRSSAPAPTPPPMVVPLPLPPPPAPTTSQPKTAPPTPAGPPTAAGSGPVVRPRVYLQIVDPRDADYAKGIGESLEQAGFTVLGVEYVRGARLKNTEVRYYKKADEPDAVLLVEALRRAGVNSAALLYLGLENNTRVRPKHYEVWFASAQPETP